MFKFSMIALLGFLPHSVLASENLLQNTSLVVNLLLLGSCLALGYLLRRRDEEARESRRKMNDTILSRLKEAEEYWLKGIRSVAVIRFDKNGKEISRNSVFDKNYGKYFSNSKSWDSFVFENFLRDKKMKNSSRMYKFIHDVKNEYFVTSSLNKVTGERICEIFKFNLLELADVGQWRFEELKNEQVNALDLFEDAIVGQLNFSPEASQIMPEIISSKGVSLFLGRELAAHLANNVITSIRAILKVKEIEDRIVIKLDRKDNKFLIETNFSSISLDDGDFEERISSGKNEYSLLDSIKAIEETSKSMQISTVIKNLSINSTKKVTFKVVVSDLDKVKWTSKKYMGRYEAAA